MERLSCYLDDGAFVRHLSNLVEDVTIVNQFISTMECIKHSYVCDLYMPSNFYAILAPDGECISQKIFWPKYLYRLYLFHKEGGN